MRALVAGLRKRRINRLRRSYAPRLRLPVGAGWAASLIIVAVTNTRLKNRQDLFFERTSRFAKIRDQFPPASKENTPTYVSECTYKKEIIFVSRRSVASPTYT